MAEHHILLENGEIEAIPSRASFDRKEAKIDKTEVLFDNTDLTSISDILQKFNEVEVLRAELQNIYEVLRNKILIFLKDRKWDNYFDEKTQLKAIMMKCTMKTWDEKQLTLMLDDTKLSMARKTSIYEKIFVVTPKKIKEMNKNVRVK